MDLLDRLRPRWRHPDPLIRVAAVREMTGEDGDRLAAVARTDPDAAVRRAAVKRIEDTALLGELAAQDTDPAVRQLATERAREVRVAVARSAAPVAACEAALAALADEDDLVAVAATAAHEAIREAALARVATDRGLREFVRASTDDWLRRSALDRIADPAQLRHIATGDHPAELALHALARITDPTVLQGVADSRTASKAVRRRARAMLPAELRDAPAIGPKQARARQIELFALASGLRGASDPMRAADRVRAAQEEWEVLARVAEPREEVAMQFEAACAAVLDEAASLARRRAEAEAVRSGVAATLASAAALCARVEALDAADGLRALETARGEWRRLGPMPDDEGVVLADRFARACDEARARLERRRAEDGTRATLEELLAEADALADATPPPPAARWQALERRWAARAREADAMDGALQQRFAQAAERAAARRREADEQQQAQQRANLRRLQDLQERLDAAVAAESVELVAARRLVEAADAALADPGPLPASERRATWRERLAAQRDRLLARLGQVEELEHWRRWANTGAQEELIRRAEALRESADLAEVTRQLGRLQEEWAAVATAMPERSQALWERFRVARNELRRRTDAYLAENLARKRALCEQVVGVGDSTDWNETALLVKRVQAEWKAIGPVPARHAKALWAAFREPCDRFFARRAEHLGRLDAERAENARRQTALCERIEALADSTDWDETAAKVKRLQADWRQIGPAPRAEANALWQRFRAGCDRFFDRSRRRDELAREDALRAGQALCDRLDAVADALAGDAAPATGEVRDALDGCWAEWVRLEPGDDDEARAVAVRLHAACARIAALRPESLEGTRLDPAATRRRREKLCARLEALLPETPAAPRPTSLQEMALALRERLAANTIASGGGKAASSGPQQSRTAEVARLRILWSHLGPVLDDEAHALAERFARACERLGAPAT